MVAVDNNKLKEHRRFDTGIVVKVADVIDTMRDNRKNHRAEFEKACEGYKKRLEEELAQRLKDVRAGRRVELYFALPEPQDHTNDYDRVIKMLELSQDKTLLLNHDDFAKYVMDDWAWKQQFTTTNATYSNA